MDIRTGSTLPGPGGETITIERLLGRGGFGQVFLGRLPDASAAAVKTVLTAALAPDELAVLQNEARLAVGVRHPNVVRVLHAEDGAASNGLPPYLVMEYVDGGSLDAVVADRRARDVPFDAAELRAMYAQIAAGMAAVNARLVHRDLKPANVLVDRATGALKVADFGLAKLVDATTRAGTFKAWGTPPYMAPEAFELGPNTPAMDVYAAGVLFYELAALDLPLRPKPGDASPLAWRNAHLLQPAPDVRAARRDLPLDLVQLVAQMLQKDPARRPDWAEVTARLARGGAPAAGAPDVRTLVARATTTYQEASAAGVRERERREQAAERETLLAQAFAEPVGVLRELVDAFNAASAVGQLTMKATRWEAEVASSTRPARLHLQGRAIPDLDLGSGASAGGVARVLAIAHVRPLPAPPSQDAVLADRESFGSCNLVYRVRAAGDRFGAWSQLRFELSPFVPQVRYPRWLAVGLDELPRELQVLRALGHYQHQERPLDGAWLQLLLAHLV